MHHIQEVHKILRSVLTDKLSDYLYSVLSNMLAIDFHARHIYKVKEIDKHSFECGYKLLRYMGTGKLLSDKFEDALKLFSIAISEDENNNKKSFNQIKETTLEQENPENAVERLIYDITNDSEFTKLKDSISSFISAPQNTQTNTFQNNILEKQKISQVISRSK
ncbi:hypothetical protein phytr_3120 [Candidatus Phycorickettsia trachydisci]|uniref:Uncharacterized protein n=1 Tax=Candidatus Phycorickettsia trachydisci TaxID=2115978 RepID=A0A2P1P7M6_9RICK|nr:RP853 family protein [Candidatus Phycorickettsia trachydisci]AVP87266.1 hypothetical protein phytr_3120 [Candidatus Phycorickettsia trachydisci]